MDIAWLGLEHHDDGRWSFELVPELARFDGKFYGGTGIAVTTAIMEAATGRDALWATAQFVGSADVGERFDCRLEELAAGKRTSQLRLTATVGDRVVLSSIGATGEARTDALNAQFGEMPDVPSPDDAGEWKPRVPIQIPRHIPSWLSLSELRSLDLPDGRQAMWARMRDMPQTRATIGFLADMVPNSVVTAAGRVGAGTSLDNAMRFGPRPETEWILVDFDPYLAAGGYGHGAARLWSTEGVLLGVASQTAALLFFD